jgi:thiamine pyrophosphokinase
LQYGHDLAVVFIFLGGSMKNALIVGGGPVDIRQLQSELADKPAILVAADRGGSYLAELSILPDTLIGDFDSLSEPILRQMSQAGVVLKSYPAAKDYTDLELALDYALENGATAIRIIGGLGGRIDHSLGNIGLLLRALERGVEAHLIDIATDIVLTAGVITIKRKPGWAVSLIPLSLSVTGVTTTGLAYGLEQAELRLQSTRGIHNEFMAETATVEISGGILMVICFQV